MQEQKMKRPAKSYKAFPAAGFLVLLVLGFAGPAFADKKPKFLYDSTPGGVSGYSVDSTTGALSLVPGSPFAAGTGAGLIAANPSGKFVYVVGNAGISAYAVDGTTGALTAVSGSPLPAGGGFRSVAIDQSGKFLYGAVDISHNNIWAYTIDATTGALTPVPGSPFDTESTPFIRDRGNASAVAIDPSGKFLYVPTELGDLLTFKIDSNTGALTLASSSFYGGGPQPATIAVDASGKFVYVTDIRDIEAYTVDGTTGELTPVTGSPFRAGIAYDPMVAIDPLGKFIYVMDNTDGSILAYIIDGNTGALTPVAGLPVASTYSLSMAVDPSGKFAYVSEQANVGPNTGIAAYAIDGTNGTLASIPGSPFAVGTYPYSLAITSTSTVPFETFKAKADIDEDRKTSFRVEGFFTLGKTSDGIDPVNEAVQLQVGPFSTNIPAGSFREEGKHEFEFEGWINDVELRITIHHVEGRRDEWGDHDAKHDEEKRGEGKDHDADRDKEKHKDSRDFLFTAQGKGHILSGVVNPVTVGLTIGDNEGSTTVKADIDR
jgi:6-phosphogluconolactonase (cycloisomerase 2 family)